MSDIVTTTREGRTGLIALNNPPVNAASYALRKGVLDAIETLGADAEVDVIAIYGEGRTFIAGADITEFAAGPKEPHLPEVIDAIETCATPVIAVLHGTALGGGLELAMGAHVRVALPDTKLGLPEILLGIFPGAGGTQRAPRLVGVDNALQMILTGKPVTAETALEWGLVDHISDAASPRDAAIAAATALREGDLSARNTRDLSVDPAPEAVAAWRAKMDKSAPHLVAPRKAIEAVEAATQDFEKGAEAELSLFRDCLNHPQSRGMVHAFFADRAVQKIPEAGTPPRDVSSVGIIGGGTMGSGIGTSMLMAGLPLTLVETSDEAIARAQKTIAGNLDGAVKRKKMTAQARDQALAALTFTTKMEDLADADLIIEAVFEEMPVKKEIFTKLDAIARDGAILATNTSYLDVNEIAAMTQRPEDVIGLHFFSPAHIMRLLEVVVADKTAPDVVTTGFALAKRLGKIAVRAGVCDGFIGNRILSHYGKVAGYLVEDGASPQQVDQALEAFGFAMGPFRVSDLAGLDIGWATRKRQAADRPAEERDVEIADRICEQGWFGRKTGRGYYVYGEDGETPNPEVAGIIDAERARKGITPREISDEEITDRYMTAMILEAARVVEDGTALRPIDVDAVLLHGYGFPRFRGGPLKYADELGAREVFARAERYAQEDPHYWQVPDILRDMAENGTTFDQLNKR